MRELWRNFEFSNIFLRTQPCVGLYFITYRPNLVLLCQKRVENIDLKAEHAEMQL
jgi:hypothetical protein